MKILTLTNRVPWPLKDGGSVAMVQMLESQVKCGFEVTLLSLNTRKHFVKVGDLPGFFKSIHTEAVEINTDIRLSDALKNLFTEESYNVERFNSDAFRNALIKLLRGNDFDIIVFESIYMALYLETARMHSKAKCILRAQNVEYEIWQQAAREGNIVRRKYFSLLARRLEKFEKEQWPRFDAIIPISKANELVMRSACDERKTKILTLPTAIRVPEENQNVKADINKIYHLGSMEWIPNQQAMKWFLDEVWQRIAFDTKASFYLAGRNMPEEFFEYKNERVHIEGEVDDAMAFVRDKQIMVVPLFAGSGLRIKILEGMALGKTVITTSVGMQGIDAENGKELIVANNAKAFANAVRNCFLDPAAAYKMGERAKELIRKAYSLENFESKLKSFYLELLAS
jgi:glycosyltransferase involved in cell wall biosynthesis